MATNYPLVRITGRNTGKVFYCRTHDHSTMGVATGATTQFTSFTVPCGLDNGVDDLVVVANGIASDSVAVTVGAYLNHVVINEAAVNLVPTDG